MFCKPERFQQYLVQHGLEDDINKAMGSDDLADPVMIALNVIKKTNHLPPMERRPKHPFASTEFRTDGNQYYRDKKYQKALACYNKALSFAPNNSREMKLAYGNRSALFLAMKAPSACLKDIDKCFSTGCPTDIKEKLRKRKDDADSIVWIERLAQASKFQQPFSAEFFKLNVERNPQIPCASKEVGVIVENQVPKVVATRDLKVGTVLAVETAFTSLTSPHNEMFSCYYCQKMKLNLIPCDGCICALFCDEECKATCMKEYHDVECQIIGMLEEITSCTLARMALNAYLKMKNMSKSWEELISASHTMGLKRVKTSSVSEIYNCEQKFSLLSCKTEMPVLNTPLYNGSLTTATIVHYLDGVTGFFPQSDDEKIEAQKATARILQYLNLYCPYTQIINCATISAQGTTEVYDHANYGWFSFISRLNNACMPNAICIGLNKEIGLVALTPITKGTELTISYAGLWLDDLGDKEIRARNLSTMHRLVCKCVICTDEYKRIEHKLSDYQKKMFKKLKLEEIKQQFCPPSNLREIFTKLCDTLALLSNKPFSEEYYNVYQIFRRCLLFMQQVHSENAMLDFMYNDSDN